MHILNTIQSISTQQVLQKKWSGIINISNFQGNFIDFQSSLNESYYDLIILDSRLLWYEEALDFLTAEKMIYHIYSGNIDQLNNGLIEYFDTINFSYASDINESAIDLHSPIGREKAISHQSNQNEVVNTIYVDRVVEKVVEVYKDVYGASDEKKIGIVNLSPQAGSSFITLNLAALLTEYKIIPAIIEPYYAPKFYRAFNFKKLLPSFVSFHHEVAEQGRVLSSMINNLYDGISFVCPNLELYHPPKWGEKEEIKLIMGTKAIVKLVDIGSALNNETYAEIMNLMDELIVVYDSISEEVDKNILRAVNQFGNRRRVHFVANRWHSQLDYDALKYKLSAEEVIMLPKYSSIKIDGMFENHMIPYRDPDFKGSIQNAFSNILGNLLTEDLINLDLKMQATFKQKNVESSPRPKEKRVQKMGVTEIGMLGVSSGVGTTHQTISFASALASQYRVAVVEQGQKRAFREIQRIMDLDIDRKSFEYNGVTYFRDLPYSEFKIHSREKFDVVIVDYGSYEDLEDYDDYLAMDSKYILAHGVDWKIHEIEMFRKLTKNYDIQSSWTYLIPFLEEHELADVRALVENKVQQIPFSKNPFEPVEEYTQLVFKLTFGFEFEGKETKKSVFKLFGRRG